MSSDKNSENLLDMKIEGCCRAEGKVYIRLTLRSAAGASLGIRATDKHGGALPASMYEIPSSEIPGAERAFVVVMPIFLATGCSYTVYDKDIPEHSATFPLNFEKAKWESRLNYRLRPALCRQIRCYDRIALYRSARLFFSECISANECNVLRVLMVLPFEEDSSFTFSCMDTKLNTIPVSPIVMNDAKKPSPITEGEFVREMILSFRIPQSTSGLVFTVHDKSHPEFDGFETLEATLRRQLLHDSDDIMRHAQFDPGYPRWFDGHKADIAVLSKQRTTFFAYRPVFSIVVPLYKTPLPFFDDMVASVRAQSYGRWELILVNASPEDEALRQRVHDAVEGDERIVSIELSENLGISENTNAGIERATGDFVSFFDHDDVLEPNILFEYASAVNEHMDTDLLYCDEDKLQPDGTLTQPFFKPDFSIDLLRNNNYICHMLTIRKSLLDELPLSTKEYDGAQDHNLTLRAVEKARHIHHVSHILYHWRISEASTAGSGDSKPYANQAGILAVQSHLDRMGLSAHVELSRRPFTYKVTYDVPSERPLVSIVIPSKDHIDILKRCIDSILDKTSYENYEILVCENNSTEPETFEFYHDLETSHPATIRIVRWEEEFNFSKIINFGARQAKGDYLLLLNNDTEVITPTWIDEMLGFCAREDVGAVGVKLLYPDDTIQHAGIIVTADCAEHVSRNLPGERWGYFSLDDDTRDVSAVTAACMMTKRSAFDSVGGFTEELTVAFNDVDFCLKLREAGLLIVYTPDIELYHYESLSRGYEESNEKRIRMHRELAYMNYRWAEYFVYGDPYYNVNLTSKAPYCRHYGIDRDWLDQHSGT